MGTNISIDQSMQDISFLEACFNGDFEALNQMISQGIDLNMKDSDGNSGVHYSVAGNKPEVLQLLIDSGADIEAVNYGKQSCLHFAAISASIECVNVLLRSNCNPNLLDSNELTPLMNAIAVKIEEPSFKTRQDKVINMLTDCEIIDLHLKGKESLNVLHFAVIFGNTSLAQKIITKDSTLIGTSDKEGNQAIHLAVTENKAEILRLLLENGAEVNAVNDFDLSALHISVKRTSVDCLDILLRNKCDVNLQDENGMTPLIIAIAKANIDSVELRLSRERVIEMLLNTTRIKFDIRVANGLNFLHVASMFGNNFAVKTLLINIPELIYTVDNNGNHAIHFAAIRGHREVIETLSNSSKITLDFKGCDDWTPLDFAILYNHFSCVEFFVSKSADCNATNNKLETSLHLAIIKFLNCRRNHKDNGCEFVDKINDCPAIREIFDNSPQIAKDKCAFFALVVYLISDGNAEIAIRDREGNRAFDIIPDDFIDCIHVSKYLETFFEDFGSREKPTRDYFNYLKSTTNDLRSLLNEKYEKKLQQKDEEIKELKAIIMILQKQRNFKQN